MTAEEKLSVPEIWSAIALKAIEAAGSLGAYLRMPSKKPLLLRRIKYWLLYTAFPWRIRRYDDADGYDW